MCTPLDASTFIDELIMADPSTFVNGWGTVPDMLPDVGPLACCGASVLAGALDEGDAEQLAHGFRALADPARIRLLSIIAASPTGEVCACDLVEPLGRAQPTVSHHLSLLVEAGLLTRTKRGRWAWYRIAPDRIELLRGALAR